MKTKKYHLDIFTNSSHTNIVNLIQNNSKVLDIGCSTGYLGEKLIKEKNCEVIGIESNHESVLEARQIYKKVYWNKSTLDAVVLDEPKKYFDYIIFADILEHTINPDRILVNFKSYLRDDGKIVISLPNIANICIRLKLLFGRFDYTESGILDRTHLIFFTMKTSKIMIESAGLRIIKRISIGRMIYYIRIFPNLFAYQFLFVTMKRG